MSDVWSEVRDALSVDWTHGVARDRAAILQERARRLAQPAAEARARADDGVFVRIGGEAAVLPASRLRDLVPAPSITPIPGSPELLVGLARMRGALAPVFDAGPLLTGRATQISARARLLTVDGPGRPDLVLLVEAVDDTRPFPAAPPVPAPTDAPPCLAGMTEAGELVIDAAALLEDPRLMVDQT